MSLKGIFIYTAIIFLSFSTTRLTAQKVLKIPGVSTAAEVGALASSESITPFWLRTNQFGVFPKQSPSGLLQLSARKDYVFFDSLNNRPRKWDWSAAVSPVFVYNKTDQFTVILPEANASVRFKNIELYAGRRKELMGIGDSTLSAGFYSGSGNALPIPKVQIGTVGFTPLKFTKNFLAVHFGFSHGWFNTDYLQGVRLHQKFLYFRLGKPQHRFKVYGGLNHNVLWAGHSEYLKQHPELAVNGELPSSWRFYPNVVFAYTSKKWYEKNGYGAFDSYRLGNHLGSYDVAVETSLLGLKIFAYHQHPFEDVSSMLFKNVPDGLYGLSIKTIRSSRKQFMLDRLTLEFLTTKDQSGETFYIAGSKYQGADNYFNHSQYSQGWSYQGRTVGTPFIAPGIDMDQSKRGSRRYFANNLFNVFHVGAQAGNSDLTITAKISFSKNSGTPGDLYEPARNQLSAMAGAQYRIPSLPYLTIIARAAVDNGEIFVNNTGGYLGLRSTF